MGSKQMKVDKNQQIEKTEECHLQSGFCMFLTMALCPVQLYFAIMPHIYHASLYIWHNKSFMTNTDQIFDSSYQSNLFFFFFLNQTWLKWKDLIPNTLTALHLIPFLQALMLLQQGVGHIYLNLNFQPKFPIGVYTICTEKKNHNCLIFNVQNYFNQKSVGVQPCTWSSLCNFN